jgi:uncharacterized protein (DUF1800 family)
MARTELPKITTAGLGRFGLGARPGDLAAIKGDIREAILEEVSERRATLAPGENILSTAEAYHRLRIEREEIRALRLANKGAEKPEDAAASPDSAKPSAVAPPNEATQATATAPEKAKTEADQKPFRRQVVRDLFQAEALARLQAAKGARVGFAERLVIFWSNHFCVSARKAGLLRVLAGPYEREAIRPHVFGRFADMLLAAERHPAMLVYLDNEQSAGPNSRGGQRQQKGLNENLAREIMELHTLGVDGGYSQDDVTSLARILTGWRFARKDDQFAGEGQFLFNPNLHEPGDHKVMGVVYREDGDKQGEEALLALARHPATAHHIARKLAVHFVSDIPSPALVDRLERTFRESGGDLSAVSRALIEAPEAWNGEATKLRTPYEFLAAALRATGVPIHAPQINGALASMGQPIWSPPGPNGFSDETAAWTSPEGMKARLDFAARLAEFVPGDVKPTDALEDIIGPIASEHTRTAVARAESRTQGFAILLMSPEFQRR